MDEIVAPLCLCALGLVFAGSAVFAWPTLQRLPLHGLRARLFGDRATRAMAIVFGLLAAAVGAFLAMRAG